MPVNIKGKEYFTVAERLDKFLKENTKASVQTEISFVGTDCLCKATITVGSRTANGHGYERIDSSFINKTSHVEVAETSAVGRALAFMGFAGTEICSAEEVANAIKQQENPVNEIKTDIPNVCCNCQGSITADEKSYSIKFFKKTLCRKCQVKVKAAQDATKA